MVHPAGVIWENAFTSSVQMSGFGCQPIRWPRSGQFDQQMKL
ncbi:hypothetical protein D1BOALGB6SA_441 [Olavius sp. associated proteobacterium Delta 1]|nr:hypothetical protein D1BOALGB6SA_441 [Olavius sp. associated proteobacterium Delta 1]